MRRRAKIVVTLGPATDGREHALVEAGIDVARLNFSHGTADAHARRARAIRAAASALDHTVALMQDLQGPKIRVGRLASGPIDLIVGARFTITTREVPGDARCVSCTYAGLAGDVRPGDRLFLDDGRIRLRALAVSATDVETDVEDGGPLSEHKGINLPGVAVSVPPLTEKDRADMRFGVREIGVDYVALSFIRAASEVRDARRLVRELGRDVPLVVKLEKGEALEQLDAIIAAADAVMVARGDLAVETAPERVPMLQKRIIHHANARGIPVITATQMLESMIVEETPTRAEASDVANAVWDGTDALMLSAETAAGHDPVGVVRMMDRIIRQAESAEPPRTRAIAPRGGRGGSHAAAVAHAARVLADDLRATAIVGATRTGRTAQLLSHGRGRVPIHAFSPDEHVRRELALWWGVAPHRLPPAGDFDANVATMEAQLLADGAISPGDTIVLVGAHPFRKSVRTNFVKLHHVAENQ